ncbi:uncharacterized protein LOC144361777 [Saccoglossus kowalevskii]
MAVYYGEGCLYDDKFRHKGECDNAAKIRQCGNCKRDIVVVKQCSACLQEWYCGDKCQTEAWPTHQKKCTAVQDDIRKIAQQMEMAPWRSDMVRQYETLSVYYWGNTPAVDLLNLMHNEWEGNTRRDRLSLLLCGVGDLRNVIKTGASLPSEFNGLVEFSINDSSPHIQARNVLFLYLLFTCDDIISMAEMLVQIWYSLCLTELCWKVLEKNLKELIRSDASTILKNTGGKCKIPEKHLDIIKNVWLLWQELGQNEGPKFHIAEQRKWLNNSDSNAKIGWTNYVNCAPFHHRLSLQEWLESGILVASTDSRRSKLTKQNVTLLRMNVFRASPYDRCFPNMPSALKNEPMIYGLPTNALPFTGWDYVDAKAYCDVPSVITMYRNYISHEIEQFGTNLKHGLMSFNVLLCDCFKLTKEISSEAKFDRISTSYIADYYGIPVVLDFAKEFLNTDNPNALIITESLNWKIFECYINPPSLNNNGIHWPNIERREIPDYRRDVAQYNGLRLREFTQQLNRVVPHQWTVNRRMITHMSGHERNLEWILLQDTQECIIF